MCLEDKLWEKKKPRAISKGRWFERNRPQTDDDIDKFGDNYRPQTAQRRGSGPVYQFLEAEVGLRPGSRSHYISLFWLSRSLSLVPPAASSGDSQWNRHHLVWLASLHSDPARLPSTESFNPPSSLLSLPFPFLHISLLSLFLFLSNWRKLIYVTGFSYD